MKDFLPRWGRALAETIRVVPYERLSRCTELPVATTIFTSAERLGAAEAAIVGTICDTLARAGAQVYNDPRRTLGRFELLRALYREGINDFRAFRPSESLATIRFPVFLRWEDGHAGSETPLLHSPAELRRALRRLSLRRPGRRVLIVEFRDASESDGLYRKYAAFRVGDRIVPRHVVFGRHWVLKHPDVMEEALLEEELTYVRSNPHEAELHRVFQLAQIDYGRVDYGWIDGRIQVWEINTGPVLMFPPERYDSRQLPTQIHFAERIVEAFRAVDGQSDGPPVAIRLDARLVRRARRAARRRELARRVATTFGVRIAEPTRKLLRGAGRLGAFPRGDRPQGGSGAGR